MKTLIRTLLLCGACLLLPAGQAANTLISTSPLEVGTIGVIPPNVMLLFDDSGSMGWDFMPDWMSTGIAGAAVTGVEKQYSTGGGGGGTSTYGYRGDPPYYAYQINGVFYNPSTVYQPPVDATGLQYPAPGAAFVSYTSANSSGWTKVPVDAFTSLTSTINLNTGFLETVHCNASISGVSNAPGTSTSYPSPKYTSSTLPTSGTTICKRNGTADTGGTSFAYNYASNTGTSGYPDGTATSTTVTSSTQSSDNTTISGQTYPYAATLGTAPHYYDIVATEYCSDTNLQTCQFGSGGLYINKAPVRYCYLQSDAISTSAVSGNLSFTINGNVQPKCQKKFNLGLGFTHPRYGTFSRINIVPGSGTYTRSASRTDCTVTAATSSTAAYATCTGDQEMTNFANWFSYYRTRIQMAKSAVGLAFNSLTSSYRVGMLTINAYSGNSLDTTKFVPMGTFNATQRTTFYNTFYALTPNNSTPLREALSRVGWYFAGKTTGLSAGMITAGASSTKPDPVQYSCQQNFTIMTTDGYWNQGGGYDLNNTAIAQVDNNTSSPYIYRGPSAAPASTTGDTTFGPGGYYDGNLGATKTLTSSGTLADVAMYYYMTDLRSVSATNSNPVKLNSNTGVDVSTTDIVNGVPNAQVGTSPGIDMNPTQHMVTYTIGLGVDGNLTYDAGGTYKSTDVLHIINGDKGQCYWAPGYTSSTVCDWPQIPVAATGDDPAKDDDLWHAAVNGRGYYLSAKNPTAFYQGLSTDLALITAQTGAAAAAATSTPNITNTNNAIFNSTFQTANWVGQLQAQTINVSTGAVSSALTWGTPGAQGQLDSLVSPAGDTRTIYTSSGGSLIPFQVGSLDTTALAWFTNLCNVNDFTQCSALAALSSADLQVANSAANLIGYLRGQGQYADGTHFRSRLHVLGDLVDSRPVVVATPTHNYADTPVAPASQTYAAWAASTPIANRESMVFIGGNDGMLHAFDAATGAEKWAYIPRVLLPVLYKLGDLSYPTQHRFYVDGSPAVGDVMDANGYWHTILVEGFNDGGSGYFALDVTNPAAPSLLWEFCSEPTLCSHSNANLGLSFGNPVITKAMYGGIERWVVMVSSGYNNNVTNSAGAQGDGTGYLFELDAISGTVLNAVSNSTGSTTTPSGLGRLTALVADPNANNTASTVYGGDLQGNLWRFDVTKSPPVVSKMATLVDASGVPQSITTRPEVGVVNNANVVYVGTGRLLDMTDLQTPTLGNWSYANSLYALVDNGTSLGNPRNQSSIIKQTLSGTTVLSVSTNSVNIPSNLGWYVDFLSTGERVNVDPQLALGTLVVTTNIPTVNNPCLAGGSSYLYQFNYANGQAAGNSSTVATLTTAAMTVGNVIVQLPSGTVMIISTLSNGAQAPTGLKTSALNQTVKHVGWRVVPQ